MKKSVLLSDAAIDLLRELLAQAHVPTRLARALIEVEDALNEAVVPGSTEDGKRIANEALTDR